MKAKQQRYLESLLRQFTNSNQSLSDARILHGLVIKTSRLSRDPFYSTKLVGFYAANNDLRSARNLFDETPRRTIYLWNYIIRAYARGRHFLDAFQQFNRLLSSGIHPDSHTFACVARACAENFNVHDLRILHCKAIVSGFGSDSISGSAFVRSYSKLGFLDEARSLFRGIDEPDLVLWNAMLSGYGLCRDIRNGMELFCEMQCKGMKPDGHTMVGLMLSLSDDDEGATGLLETIHGYCLKRCLVSKNSHVGSSLVSVYSKLENLDSAFGVFADLLEPDVVSWSAIITGFSDSGQHFEALKLLREMLMTEGRKPDHVLLATALSASARLSISGPGAEIHGYALRHGCNVEVAVSSALVDMYAKCGFLKTALRVFGLMPVRNAVSYNIVISSLGLYGFVESSIRLLNEMVESGFLPDETAFSGILSACCHSGLVSEGREYFKMMTRDFGIKPNVEHHVYMVKLLGMNGGWQEAYDMIASLPEEVEKSSLWGALLTCGDADCVSRNEVEKRLSEEDSKNGDSGYRVMVSNAYAGGGRWENVGQLRFEMGGKIVGTSRILDSNRSFSCEHRGCLVAEF